MESQHSARGLNTKMPKEFRLADGVLDLELVKLVNLGMNPDKSNWNLSIIWEYMAQIYKGALELNTGYVSNQALIGI